MSWRWSKINSKLSPWIPLLCFVSPSVNWATKCVMCGEFRSDINFCKSFDRGCAIGFVWKRVTNLVCIPQCTWPEIDFDCGWPACFGMQQLLSCLFLQIPNSFFSDAILEMCIYTAIGERLSLFCCICDECIVCESSIVGMIVSNCNVVSLCECFECSFGFKCLF